jgi:hypothetical protein
LPGLSRLSPGKDLEEMAAGALRRVVAVKWAELINTGNADLSRAAGLADPVAGHIPVITNLR